MIYSGEFHSPKRIKYMDTSKYHFCYEGEQKGIWLFVFTRVCKFSKWAFGRTSFISAGKKGRLKPGKLLNLIGHIRNETRQLSISLLWYSRRNIFQRRAAFCQTPGLLWIYPVAKGPKFLKPFNPKKGLMTINVMLAVLRHPVLLRCIMFIVGLRTVWDIWFHL